MAGPYQIDYIEFPSTDADRTRKFFGDAFGWTFQTYSPTYHEIHGAGLLGGIEGGAPKTAGPTAGVRTTDLEAARNAVIAAGGTITVELFVYPGGKRFHFREPGGSELLVYQVTE